MTDQKQRTLALNTRQWRVLLHDNLDVLKGAVQQTETLTAEGLKEFCGHLDTMKQLAGAWFQVSPQAAEPIAEVNVAQSNGAAVVKKKRGRPSNAELAARQAVQ